MVKEFVYRCYAPAGWVRTIGVADTMRRASRVAGALLLLLSTAGLARSQEALASIAADVQRIYENAKGAVVRIESEDDFGKLAGTGFLIDPNGTIYTAYDVGGESRDITVEFGSNRYPAQRLVADAKSGVAILKVDADTPWIPLGNSDELKLASPVVSIGYPLDLPATPTFGLIGGFDLKYLNRYFSTTLVRANLPVQKGEAGSPILNLKGEAVGILIRSIGNQSACYALPMKAAEKIRSDYVRYGTVRPGWLGVSVREREDPIGGSKVEIAGLEEHSPAERSGLQIGDTLLQVGQVKVRTAPDTLNVAFFLTAGDQVPVTVVRDGKALTVDLTAADMPASPNREPSMLLPGLSSELRSPAEFPSYP
jgi:serine protease Do